MAENNQTIGIIDADLLDGGTRHPNLALMKISGYHKSLGRTVRLIESYDEELEAFDALYMSKVFSYSKVPGRVLALPNLIRGGTGFYEDGGENLPHEIEHHMPDYSLYDGYVKAQLALGRKPTQFSDYLDYSIGFATRGCFRKCSFCVNKKYDHAFRHSPISEFLDESRPYIYLWDDNILAYPRWDEVLDELEATGKQFQFRQGIDLRLMTDEKARRLNATHYQGDFIFAFDHLSDREEIVEKVQLWKRYSSKVCKMYVLSGYESQDEHNIADVFERINTLMDYGSLPYIMRHENYKASPHRGMYVELARWCNQPQFFKKKSFREFCRANQDYKKNQATNCSAYQAMLDFEARFPAIAQRYFDLKFEHKNLYRAQYGYGRRYANKPSCQFCKSSLLCWDALEDGGGGELERLLGLYLVKEMDLQCLTYRNAACGVSPQEAARALLCLLERTPWSRLAELVAAQPRREPVSPENIPQFSDMADAFYGVTGALSRSAGPVTYAQLGQALYLADKKDQADKKYGENHGKLAALLDLAVISRDSSSALVRPSVLGEAFGQLPFERRHALLPKLCLRIPIVQNAVLTDGQSVEGDMSMLSGTTRKRRMPNVLDLIRFAKNK